MLPLEVSQVTNNISDLFFKIVDQKFELSPHFTENNRMHTILTALLLLNSPLQATENPFDFEQLKNCFQSTNSNFERRNQVLPESNSTFLSSIIEDGRLTSSYDALMFKEQVNGRTQVHVIQDTTQNKGGLFKSMRYSLDRSVPRIRATFTIPQSNIRSQNCPSRGFSNTLLLGGYCTNQNNERCILPQVSLDLVRTETSSRICPPQKVFDNENRLFAGDLALTDTPSIIERAIVDRLTYLDKALSIGGLNYDSSNIETALSASGACLRVLQPTPTSITSQASKVLCQVAPQRNQACPRSSISEETPMASGEFPSNDQSATAGAVSQ